ncbi:hypothetical protein Dvina_31635 [Dactylosporangium vinaceum]|uniref:DUF5666 domain-containing protein n=1 Tax=Dactylosporangium vinaceum TaxID=53362 RepID=A0ABV5MAW3_9ACTN|nr:hypothetical protein [Dactylosporangium vinaceum]UAB92853.1 hypothetical protein Dvina_31635 [Dactylosporangium vinaceum]
MYRTRRTLVAAVTAGALITGAPLTAAAQPTPAPPGESQSSGSMTGMSDVLHGEGILQTKQGPVRVAVQQGTAGRVSGSSLTVRSSDGFSRTWTISSGTKVLSSRNGLQAGPIGAGTKVLVAGTVQGTGQSASYTATYVLLHDQPAGGPGSGSGPATEPTTEPSAEATTG